MANFPSEIASSLPVGLAVGSVTMYPSDRTISCKTTIVKFGGTAEQRWKAAYPLNSWNLTYSNVSAYDRGRIETFFDEKKGSFEEWSIVFVASCHFATETTFDHMVFDQDELEFTEGDKPGRYSCTIKCTQIRKN